MHRERKHRPWHTVSYSPKVSGTHSLIGRLPFCSMGLTKNSLYLTRGRGFGNNMDQDVRNHSKSSLTGASNYSPIFSFSPPTYMVSDWLWRRTTLNAIAPSSPIILAPRPRLDSDEFPTKRLARACPPVIPILFRDRSSDRIVGCPVRAPRKIRAPPSPIRDDDRSNDLSMQGGVSSVRDT